MFAGVPLACSCSPRNCLRSHAYHDLMACVFIQGGPGGEGGGEPVGGLHAPAALEALEDAAYDGAVLVRSLWPLTAAAPDSPAH